MGDNKQASFIPKTSNKTARKVRKTRRIYLIGYISYVFFFGTVLVVLGAYFYGIQVDKALEIKKQELLDKKTRFNESHISYLQEMDERLSLANSLLNGSAAPSRLFTELEKSVIDTVTFSTMNINAAERDSEKLTASFTGRAATFDDAVYQRELIEGNPVLNKSKVSSFNYGADSENEQDIVSITAPVQFTYEIQVNPSILPYDPAVYTDTTVSSSVENATTTVTESSSEATTENSTVDNTQTNDTAGSGQ